MTDGMTFRLVATVSETPTLMELPGGKLSWWQMGVDVRQRGRWDASRRSYGPDEVYPLTLRLADEAARAHAQAVSRGDRVLVLGHVHFRRWVSQQGRESVFQDWMLDALTPIDGRRKQQGAAAPAPPATPAPRGSGQNPGQGGSSPDELGYKTAPSAMAMPHEDDDDIPF